MKCFIVGNPVEHSLSPGLHEIIYRAAGIDWVYEKKEAGSPEELKRIAEEARSSETAGFNVTIPFKSKIMKYLDYVSPDAEGIGAVNTVVNSSGKLKGYNTDWIGFLEDLKASGIKTAGLTAAVTGAGGAGRAVVWALLEGGCRKIYLNDRRQSAVDSLTYDLDRKVREKEAEILRISTDKIHGYMELADVFVNATPLGMNEGDPAPVDLISDRIKTNLAVYDVVYNRKTELLKKARQLGLKSAGGIGMLARQGIEAFNLWASDRGIEYRPDRKVAGEIKEYLRSEVE